MLRAAFALAAALVLGAALVACGDDDGATPTATVGETTPAATEPSGATPPAPTTTPLVRVATPAIGEVPFGRAPVEVPAIDATAIALLTNVQTGAEETYDRALFQFEGTRPGYRVEYISAPAIACGSGEPVEVAGQALLQVRLSPAQAHDEAGAPTSAQNEFTPNLPALLELERTCDFEGEVVWVLGLVQEVDFRVFDIADTFLVVDVLHP